MSYWFLLIPFLSALIGWLLFRLFLQSLFYPRLPKRFMGFTFQGAISRRQQAWAGKLGRLAAKEWAAFDIEEKISDPANVQNLMPLVEAHMDDFLRHRLKEQIPMLGMLIGDKTIQTLKIIFLKEIEALFPDIIRQFAGNLKNELDIEGIVSKRLAGLSPGLLESLFSKELVRMAWLGALTGFLVGLVQLGIAYLLC